jgi:hypothetical protein
MAEGTKVTLEELLVSNLAMTEATVKLLMAEVKFRNGLAASKREKVYEEELQADGFPTQEVILLQPLAS